MGAPALRPSEPWPFTPCSTEAVGVDADVVEMAATQVLWALSGRRFGFTDIAGLRPASRNCFASWAPQRVIGSNVFVGSSLWTWPGYPFWNVSASNEPTQRVKLPGPISALHEVRVDGANLVLTGAGHQVRVDNWRELVRVDGGLFPVAQDVNADDGPNTFITSFQRGRAVPELGMVAMGELVDELARSCSGQACSLPSRVRERTRKGMTEVFLDPMDFVDKGRTGLPKVDLFLMTFNPKGLNRRARVSRADAVEHRRSGT